ncbi:MAG: segregation and condensation protein A [Planctomycetota bacterium]
MDLLLHLVRQQEVDIHDISISNILGDYLAHLDVLKALDLSDIGDFVVMASTLMEIKSRELLPREEISVTDELDPKDDLIRRLLEYKRYRDISRRLERMMHRRSRMLDPMVALPRGLRAADANEDLLDLAEVGIWTLTGVFARLLEETGTDQAMHFDVSRRTVHYYTDQVLNRIKSRGDVDFHKVFDLTEGRIGLIGAFTAVLEIMKQGYLQARQKTLDGPITLSYIGPEGLTADDVLNPPEEEPPEEEPPEEEAAEEEAAEEEVAQEEAPEEEAAAQEDTADTTGTAGDQARG